MSRNGDMPYFNSYNKQPNDHKSELYEDIPSFKVSSGAIVDKFPRVLINSKKLPFKLLSVESSVCVVGILRAYLKSDIFIIPHSSMRKFLGWRSPCMIPRL